MDGAGKAKAVELKPAQPATSTRVTDKPTEYRQNQETQFRRRHLKNRMDRQIRRLSATGPSRSLVENRMELTYRGAT